MSTIGYVQVRAYTSFAQIPLQNVAIMVSDSNGDALAFRLTDRNGKIEPIEIEVPDLYASQSPDTGVIPYRNIQISARVEDYEQLELENVQVFPGILTVQDLEMIPLSEYPNLWSALERFQTQPQNL